VRRLKVMEKQLSDAKVTLEEISPCIVERGDGFVRVDGDGECWKRIVGTYILPNLTRNPAPTQIPVPKEGPGTELQRIFSGLGINAIAECGCGGKIEFMNHVGIEGCRLNRQMIIDWLRDGQKRYSWADRVIAAANVMKSGLALKIRWTDPLPALVDLAIERAETPRAAGAA
jgi:hypothetical protein